MTEKEKWIINQELWLLIIQNMKANRHSMEISGRILKIVCKLEGGLNNITPQKRKVVEEFCLLRDFLATVNADLKEIETELGGTGIVFDMPDFDFRDELWLDGGEKLTTLHGEMSAFQSRLSECIFQLQGLAG